jgi:ribulose-phosphate 3-epimerase
LPCWELIDYEVDLMVSKTEEEFRRWVSAGAARIIIHIESLPDPKKLIDEYKGVINIGLALNPETSLDTILPYIHDIDFLQCMGIQKIGFQGQKLHDAVLSRISHLRDSYPDLIISIDGGVTRDNAELLVTAGARRLVSGSAIFESTNPLEVIHSMESL